MSKNIKPYYLNYIEDAYLAIRGDYYNARNMESNMIFSHEAKQAIYYKDYANTSMCIASYLKNSLETARKKYDAEGLSIEEVVKELYMDVKIARLFADIPTSEGVSKSGWSAMRHILRSIDNATTDTFCNYHEELSFE